MINSQDVKNCADMEAHIAQVISQIDANLDKGNAGTRLLRAVIPEFLRACYAERTVHDTNLFDLYVSIELLIINILDTAINSASFSQNESIKVLDCFINNIRYRVSASLLGEDVPGATAIEVEPRKSS